MTIRYFLLLFVSFSLSLNAFAMRIDPQLYENSSLAFKSHSNYLTMEVNYPPVKRLYEELQSHLDIALKTRGEAHITVVTPIEFDKVLKKKMSIQEIDALAKAQGIQSFSFEAKCVGMGKATIKGKEERTYFVVVHSEDLLRLRKEIHDQFVKNGGDTHAFDPNNYYSHITIGFTARDLHEADGVIKGTNSCLSDYR